MLFGSFASLFVKIDGLGTWGSSLHMMSGVMRIFCLMNLLWWSGAFLFDIHLVCHALFPLLGGLPTGKFTLSIKFQSLF